MKRAFGIALLAAACAGAPAPRVANPPATAPVGTTPEDAFRARPPEPTPDVDFAPPRIRAFELANGVRVRAVHRSGPLCSVLVHVLSSDQTLAEYAARSVLAVELRAGTTAHHGFDIQQRIVELGARFGVSAELDSLDVSVVFPPESLDGVLSIITEILTTSTFPVAAFDAQREYLAIKRNAAASAHAALADRSARQALFGATHAIAHAEATAAELRAVRREDVLASYARLVDPKRTIVAAAGACDDVQLRPTLEAHLGALKGAVRAAAPAGQWWSAPPARRKLVVVDAPGAPQVEVIVAARGPAVLVDDWYTGLVAAQVVRDRARARVQHELGLTEDVTVRTRGWGPSGMISVSASVRASEARSILAELERLFAAVREPDHAAVAAARARILLQEAGSFEVSENLAWGAASVSQYGRDVDGFVAYRAAIQRTEPADVRAYAVKYLDPAAMVAVVVGDLSALRALLREGTWRPAELRDVEGNLVSAYP